MYLFYKISDLFEQSKVQHSLRPQNDNIIKIKGHGALLAIFHFLTYYWLFNPQKRLFLSYAGSRKAFRLRWLYSVLVQRLCTRVRTPIYYYSSHNFSQGPSLYYSTKHQSHRLIWSTRASMPRLQYSTKSCTKQYIIGSVIDAPILHSHGKRSSERSDILWFDAKKLVIIFCVALEESQKIIMSNRQIQRSFQLTTGSHYLQYSLTWPWYFLRHNSSLFT
jgi:hypothetical protein